jgi:hypothetical protein
MGREEDDRGEINVRIGRKEGQRHVDEGASENRDLEDVAQMEPRCVEMPVE